VTITHVLFVLLSAAVLRDIATFEEEIVMQYVKKRIQTLRTIITGGVEILSKVSSSIIAMAITFSGDLLP
jgi:phosphopantetheine adenylyltransferase